MRETIYYFNVKFHGSKEQFYEFLKNYRIAREFLENDPYRWVIDIERPAVQTTKDMIFLWDNKHRRKTLAFIKLQTLPENQTLLIVFLTSSSLNEFNPYWLYLRDELMKQGWLDTINHRKNEDSSTEFLEWFPKSQKTRAEWKELYKIIQRKKKEFSRLYKSAETEDPEPNIDDLRDAIANKTGKKTCERKVRYIIKAGNNGLLD